MTERNWVDEAACKGMDTDKFFPPRGENQEHEGAVAVCHTCPVRQECLRANIGEVMGIWGGTSGRERLRIRNAERV